MLETTELSKREPESLTASLLEEQIALRAYELYASRGYLDGYDLRDWLQAEQELTSQSDLQTDMTHAAAG